MNELIEILEMELTPAEVVELLNEVFQNKNIELKNKLEEYAVKNHVCPECAGQLMWHFWKENRGYWGFPAYEDMSELKCESCGWSS